MSISAPFITRPIATALVMVALLAVGLVAYTMLPIAALPQVDFPTISVSASLPGADPEIMASSVAQPLERQFAVLPGIQQITSSSTVGTTGITLQFALDRNVDTAAGDVQAAINAASGFLPKDLPSPPTYKKINPADQPVIILGLTSKTLPLTEVDGYADVNVAQRLSFVDGVAQVNIAGEQKFAPTIELNPLALAAHGLSLSDVSTAISNATAQLPMGTLQGPGQATQTGANGQLFNEKEFTNVIVAYRNGSPVRLGDVGRVATGAENPLIASWIGRERGLMVLIYRLPGSNLIKVADKVKAMLPQLQATIPPSVKVTMVSDRSVSIRAAVSDVKMTLVFTIVLVVLVVFIFLRTFWSTVIPGIAVPLSLIGTLAFMYVLGYSLDNLSLMALTLATGLVVDDAVVMIENVFRHLEEGKDPQTAALEGAAEVGFTIVSITVSLIAVFIPILLMSGIVGRLFREFGVVVSIAVILSAFIALTLTPMMCALVLQNPKTMKHGKLYAWSEKQFERVIEGYKTALKWVLKHRQIALAFNLALVVMTVLLLWLMPKGFFPQEDTGLIFAFTEASEDVSFDALAERQQVIADIIMKDPAVATVGSSIGAGGASTTANTGRLFITLKDPGKRDNVQKIVDRLRPQLARVPGIEAWLQPIQNLQVGGRLGRSEYQYTLQDLDLKELDQWAPKMQQKLTAIPGLIDVATDRQLASPQLMIEINRDKASRLGVNPTSIEDTLYSAFGRRWITELYGPLNTFHVVLAVDPDYQADASALTQIYVPGANGAVVPLSEFATFVPKSANLSVNHQGQFPSVTLSYNLNPGASLGDAVAKIRQAEKDVGLPKTIQSSFQGSAQAFEASLRTEPALIAASLIAIYIILGVLYESFIHPVTILLSLPSALAGGLACLALFGMDLSVIAIIGLLMLIGIVKKNAIMMIDFALSRMRGQGRGTGRKKNAEKAIFEAAVLRFRPIMMTTLAAMVGTLPIALGLGAGAELRQPLGVVVVAGLLVSQALTLFTIPVTFIYMDRLGEWVAAKFPKRKQQRKPRAPRSRKKTGGDESHRGPEPAPQAG